MLDFYVDKDQKKEFSKMKWYKKIYKLPIWLLKTLFFRLSQFRRIIFVLSFLFFFLFIGNNESQSHRLVIY